MLAANSISASVLVEDKMVLLLPQNKLVREMKKNPGFDPDEISQLKEECTAEGRSYVYVEDGMEEDEEIDEHAHIQFVGKHAGEEVIYDAFLYTLRLHHAAQVYDLALERVRKQIPSYIPPDERDPGKDDEDNDLLLTEFIEEIEDSEELKVSEHVEIEDDFDFGIGLEVGLNVEDISEDVIEKFIGDFNSGNLELDPGLYSFYSEDEDY